MAFFKHPDSVGKHYFKVSRVNEHIITIWLQVGSVKEDSTVEITEALKLTDVGKAPPHPPTLVFTPETEDG